MQTAISSAQWAVRLTGMTQVVLGLLFWTGHALHLRQAHMAIGMAFVIALWGLAGLAARAGLGPARVLLAVGWGVLIPVFGITHAALLPGPSHWVVQLAHLLIGMAAMVLAARLARFARSRAGTPGSGARPAMTPATAGS